MKNKEHRLGITNFHAYCFFEDCWVPRQSLVIEGERVLCWGDYRELKAEYPDITWHDADGSILLPGLWDTHIHVTDYAFSLERLSLRGVAQKQILLSLVESRLPYLDEGGWLFGSGWQDEVLDLLPSRQELDQVCGDTPCVLWRLDWHSAMVNTAALRAAGMNPESFPFILGDHQLPLLQKHIPKPTKEELYRALPQALDRLREVGVLGVVDQRLAGHKEGRLSWETCIELQNNQELDMHYYCNVDTYELEEWVADGYHYGFEKGLLKLGHVKLFSDGSLGSLSCRMSEPFFREHENRGQWFMPVEELEDRIAQAVRHGFPCSIHAIGDEAVSLSMKLLKRYPSPEPLSAHRIEHMLVVRPEDLVEWMDGGIIASVQPGHLISDLPLFPSRLGDHRVTWGYPFATWMEKPELVAFGSDAPIDDPSPWRGLYALWNYLKGQRVNEGAYPLKRLLKPYLFSPYIQLGYPIPHWRSGCLATFNFIKHPLDQTWLELPPDDQEPKVVMQVLRGKILS